MGEAFLVGSVVIGGLVARYMKAHPFYKHKTQKYKERYQHKLSNVLTQKYSQVDSYWLSRAIADHIFDFGQRTYHDYHVERYEKKAKSERPHLYELHIERPALLCEQLTERAIDLKVPVMTFSKHMRKLFNENLVPVGRLSPKTIERIPNSSLYVTELQSLSVSQDEMTLFMHHTSQNH